MHQHSPRGDDFVVDDERHFPETAGTAMALPCPLRKQSILLCVILTVLVLVNPSVAFGVPGAAQKTSKNQAVISPLFRSNQASSSPLFRNNQVPSAGDNLFRTMTKQRKLTSRLIPFASASAAMDATPKEGDEEEEVTWKDRLLKVSNIASILCVIDCTVLPLVTIIMPLLGLAAFTPAQMEWLHNFGHQVAMYFVIPVGGTAALLNYSSHKKWKLSAPAALGLALIYLANGHGGPILSRLPHDLAHSLHCGAALHRATNVAGCALLLGSNYKSHQATHAHGDCCHHDH